MTIPHGMDLSYWLTVLYFSRQLKRFNILKDDFCISRSILQNKKTNAYNYSDKERILTPLSDTYWRLDSRLLCKL